MTRPTVSPFRHWKLGSIVLAGFILLLMLIAALSYWTRSAPPPDLSTGSEATGKPLNLPALAQKARGAVVMIVGYDAAGRPIKSGSGFFISSGGRLVTNHHVIQEMVRAQAKLQNGAIYEIQGLLASSPKLDLAVLQADARDVQMLLIDRSSGLPEPGMRIAVFGSPLMYEGSLSEGIVSAIRGGGEDGTQLQITASISHGSSGSPVLDRHGAVVGVATAVDERGQNVNFARSANDLWNLLQAIPSNAKAQPLSDITAWQRNRILSDPDFIAATDHNSRGEAAAALKLLNPLMQRYPNDSRLIFQLALAHEALGLHDEAYRMYRAYIEVEPTDVSGWHNFAVVAANLNQLDEAINACVQTLKMKPDVETWRMLAALYQAEGQTDLSADATKKASELAFNNLSSEKREKIALAAAAQADALERREKNAGGQGASGRGVIDDPDGYVNLRANPNLNAPLVAQVKAGTVFKFERKGNEDWCKVTLESGVTGWMHYSRIKPPAAENAVSPSPPSQNPRVLAQDSASDKRPIYVVVAPVSKQLNIRSDSNAKSAIIAVINDGDRVFLEEGHLLNTDPPHPTTWQKVTSANGQTGWCDFDYLATSGEGGNSPRARAQQVRELLKDWLKISNTSNPADEASLYADPVDYLDFGVISRQQLVRELAADLQKWPKQYNTISTEPVIEELSDSEWRATFEINFNVTDPAKGKQVTGSANLTWTVRKRSSGGVEITSAKEEVKTRTRSDIKRAAR